MQEKDTSYILPKSKVLFKVLFIQDGIAMIGGPTFLNVVIP